MHSSKILKICKIESKAFAKYCVNRGVDYLGVHVIKYELKEDVRDLIKYIRDIGGKPILLTKETNIETINKLIAFYEPYGVQLHRQLSHEKIAELKVGIARPLITVITDDITIEEAKKIVSLGEFTVYDSSFKGGTGATNSGYLLSFLTHSEKKKILLAGGVAPEVVDKNMDIAGYDVQSYTRQYHSHHYERASRIIDAAKGYPINKIDVSLTDAKGLNIPEYTSLINLHGYHLDYSLGALYSNFVVDVDHIDKTLLSIDAPFTIHIFETNVDRYQKAIDHFMSIAPSKILCFNIQYGKGLDVEAIDTYSAKKCVSLYYKDLDEYTSRYGKIHAPLSIILPSDMDRKLETIEQYRSFLEATQKVETWYDRKVDRETAEAVIRVNPDANFIAGEHILSDWKNLNLIVGVLHG